MLKASDSGKSAHCMDCTWFATEFAGPFGAALGLLYQGNHCFRCTVHIDA